MSSAEANGEPVESQEVVSESPLPKYFARLLTDRDGIIDHAALYSDLEKGELPSILQKILESFSDADRSSIATNLLKSAMDGVRATPDGQFIDSEAENAFLLACRLGAVSDDDCAVYVDKFMKQIQEDIRRERYGRTIDQALEDLVTMGVVTPEQVIMLEAKYRIDELELPEAEEEGN